MENVEPQEEALLKIELFDFLLKFDNGVCRAREAIGENIND